MISIEDVRDAAGRLKGIATHTPVLESRTINARLGATVFLKAECFQRSGSFKFRGAYNNASRLSPEQLARGVASFSSGNHAAALALAAKVLGTHAVIVMPRDGPEAKRAATEGYGAEIVTYDRYTENREEIGAAIAAERGLAIVPPYDHPHTMAGQGTAALEFFGEVGTLDVLVVPIGGGGLMAGCSTVAKALQGGIHLVGVEPEAADDTRQSLEAGARIDIGVPKTIADGLQAPTPGELTFEVNRRYVDDVVVVSDPELREAMIFLFERMKVVVEPSGAAGVAAALAGKLDLADKRVGIIVSGGNVGVRRFCELMEGI